MVELIENPKGVYKLYRISNRHAVDTGRLVLGSVEEMASAGNRNWEYVAATSMQEAIEAWRAKPATAKRESPVAVELMCVSLMIVGPE